MNSPLSAPEVTALSRRDREQLRHRQEILAAAERVLAEKGFFNATMEDIAQQSEFAIGSLYKHFKSKDAIVMALIDEKIGAFVDRTVQIVEEARPFPELLDAFLTHFITFHTDNYAFFRFFHLSQGSADWHKEGIRQCMHTHLRRFGAAVEHLMTRGVAEGHLRPLPAPQLGAFMTGALHGFFFRMMEYPDPRWLQESQSVIKSLLLGGIAQGELPT